MSKSLPLAEGTTGLREMVVPNFIKIRQWCSLWRPLDGVPRHKSPNKFLSYDKIKEKYFDSVYRSFLTVFGLFGSYWITATAIPRMRSWFYAHWEPVKQWICFLNMSFKVKVNRTYGSWVVICYNDLFKFLRFLTIFDFTLPPNIPAKQGNVIKISLGVDLNKK